LNLIIILSFNEIIFGIKLNNNISLLGNSVE